MSAAVAPETLVARTERLDAEVDLVTLAGEDGVLFEREARGAGFAGRGVAVRIEIPRTTPDTAAAATAAALGAITTLGTPTDPSPGHGPVALGAWPFAPDRPGTLIVPRVLIGRGDDGARWVTTVLPDGAGVADHDRLVESTLTGTDDDQAVVTPERFEVRATRPATDWQAAVVAARDELRAGVGRKVVLAREVTVTADRPLSRLALTRRLRRAYPGCTVFAVDGFAGATPELLVARAGDVVRAQPMAGTAPRSADPTTDARLAAGLLASAKDQSEHRHTIDMVHDTLLPFCSYLDEEAEPSVVVMANVQHLATRVEGRLSAPAASVIELMASLHPTPAVGGCPRQIALDLIDAHEQLDRGRYGGPVGWVDAAGNGEWMVGIRSAELDGCRARVFAGVGVVAGSDPDAELAETRAKLEAVLAALIIV
jgi:isochorismate synthase